MKKAVPVTKENWPNLKVVVKNKIAEHRKALGYSQHRLAKAIGLKRHAIMAYENYTIPPTLEVAYKIAQVLNKDVNEIFLFNDVVLIPREEFKKQVSQKLKEE